MVELCYCLPASEGVSVNKFEARNFNNKGKYMALIECHECKNKVSTEAKKCPSCGAKIKIVNEKPKRSINSVGKIAIAAIFLIIFTQAVGNFLKKDKTPEEIQQDAAQQKIALATKAENDKKSEIAAKRESSAAIAAQAIRKSARNPQSVEWVEILANDDASVICYELRAQNGFGGMGIEDIAVIKGVVKTSDSAWNSNCANKTLNDVTAPVIKLLKTYG